MPRTGRIIVPHTPHHLVQRGHNRRSVFAEPNDYLYYLETLAEFKAEFEIKLYAYCLMTNHVHLIVEPGEDGASVGRLMRRLAGRQTRLVNALEKRVGTLWAGRYKASPIQTAEYLLACCRYVELNPVRAGMTDSPAAYEWSSYRSKIGAKWPAWLDMDACYRALGSTQEARANRYRVLVEGAPVIDDAFIRESVQRNQLTGNQRFVDEVEQRIGRRIEHRRPGRPRKERTD